ncbi:hypothetical protein BKA70DRAFT_1537781 [Coprinopsis sp. MPI-PUGE-AT-0042]|nr:hypothetical protein BKA70DRAFT_1537781 [Coprinopsis sp. MPI-PUGE-AT-0042]
MCAPASSLPQALRPRDHRAGAPNSSATTASLSLLGSPTSLALVSLCILVDADDIDRAKQIELVYISVDASKRLNKNTTLSRFFQGGDFPHAEDFSNQANEFRSVIRCQLKVPCLGVALGHTDMTDRQVLATTMLSTSFFSQFKNGGQDIKSRHTKSAMCKPVRL